MDRYNLDVWLRYGVAVAAAAAAVILRLFLQPVLGAAVPYFTYFLAIALSSWYGGIRPGLLTTALSAAAAIYFAIRPEFPGALDTLADHVGLAFFILFSIFLTWVNDLRYQANAELRASQQSEHRLRLWAQATLAGIGDGIIATDVEGKIEYMNAVAETFTGWTTRESVGRPIEQVFVAVNEQSGVAAENPVRRALRGASGAVPGQCELIARNGLRVPLEGNGTPIRDESGTVTGAVIAFRDVTALRREQHRLEKSERMQREILESIQDAFIAVDAQWRFTYLNKEAARLLGHPVQSLLGRIVWQEFPDMHGTIIEESARRALQEGVAQRYERFDALRGRWVEANLYPSLSGGLSVYFRDITARKASERRIGELEEKFRRLVDANVIGIILSEASGRIHFANDEFLRIVGYTRDDFEKGLVNWRTFTPVEQLYLDERGLAEATEHGACTPYEKEYIRKDGTRVPVLVGYILVAGESVAFIVDLTERKRMEVELLRAQEDLNLAMRAARMGLWTSSAETRLLEFSPELESLFGLPPGRSPMTPEECLGLVHPDDRAAVVAEIRKSIEENREHTIEFRYTPPSGEVRWMEGRGRAFRDHHGTSVRLTGIIMDITERRHAAETARLAGEEVQQFAWAASHDLKEPLRMVSSYVQLLVRNCPESLDREGREFIAFINNGVAQMNRVVDALLDYSRAGLDRDQPAKRVSLEEAFRTSLGSLSLVARESEAVITHDSLPDVMATEFGVNQVLQNLIGNALKYTAGNKPRIHVSAAGEGPFWVISVQDNGPGIPLKDRERIFSLFTRLHGREVPGTGIGLAACKKIVENYGGRIWVESVEGKGSTFYFTLPAADLARPPATAMPSPSSGRQSSAG